MYESKSVTIVEVMGRNSGWLAASSALSRLNGNIESSLIYLCERIFNECKFIKHVKEKLKTQNRIIVAVSEGIKTKNENYLSSKCNNENQGEVNLIYNEDIPRYLKLVNIQR